MANRPRIKLRVKIEGQERILRRLREFKQAKVNQIARNAAGVGGRMLAKTAKGLAPRDSGALKKALACKVVTRKDGKGAIAIIGARRAVKRYKVQTGAHTRGWKRETTKFGKSLKGRQKGRDPANYIHLAEYGHRVVTGGTVARIRRTGKMYKRARDAIMGLLMGDRSAAIEKNQYRSTRRAGYKGRSSRYRRWRKMGIGFIKQIGTRGRGQVVGKVEGTHFMEFTWNTMGPAAKAIIQQEMARGVLRELAKKG